MDRRTVFTKTAKGLMEATGKTSVLPRDLRALLKEIDGKITVGEVQDKLGRVPEAKLQVALNALAKDDYIREFTHAAHAAAPPPTAPAAVDDMDLDFTVSIPTLATIARQAEEAARQKARAAATAQADVRAKVAAELRASTATAEAAARARVEAETKAKAEAWEQARIAAAAEAAARASADAKARARSTAGEAAARARSAAAEAAARTRAEARARAEAEARAKAEAQARARREAEETARKEADARAKAEEQARIDTEARARKEAEDHARVEAELKARLEEERRAREEAERKGKEEAARARKEAEEKARCEADELRAKLEEERRAREEAERKAKEEAGRVREAAEEKARREADELRARLEEERRVREDAEREAKAEAERKAREDAERKAREEAEHKAKAEAERSAKEDAERVASEAVERARMEAEDRARADAEHKEKERAERIVREAEEGARREAEDQAKREAEARARREAEEESRRDAEEKGRREAAEQVRMQAPVESGTSLDDLVRIETDFDAVLGVGGGTQQEAAKASAGADEGAQRDAAEKALAQAAEQATAEAQEIARREAEREGKRDEEERRREHEQAQGRQRAEDRVREEPATREQEQAELQARFDALNEETERHFAEMQKQLETEAASKVEPAPDSREEARKRDKEEARARARAEAALHVRQAKAAIEDAPAVYRTPINWGKPVALGLFLILLLGLVVVHLVPFDGYIPQFEKLAGAHLRQPVKIKALHLSLVPLPHWRLDGVRVGNEGQLEVARINAVAELGSMFSDRKVFKSIELESPALSEEGLLSLLFGKSQGQDLKVASIIVKNGKLNSKTIILHALDATIAMGEDGAWQKIALETPDHKTSLVLESKGDGAQLEVETNAFSMPFGPAFILEDFSAKGVLGRDELRLSEFKGAIYGGYLSGNASLKWSAGWSLGGEIGVRAMDPGRFAPALLDEGKLEGKAVYAMRANSYDELFAAPRLEGTFAVRKGSLLGVDLARLLQGGSIGGKTAFAELSGHVVYEGGKTQLRQVRLGAGLLSAGGNADADASKNISGRFAVELKSPVTQARANLAVSGKLSEPHFNR